MLVTIAIVYALSAAISVPQVMLRDLTVGVCSLSKSPAYVVASACGSFYVPCLILCFVYVKIYLAARNRLRRRRGVSVASTRVTTCTQRGSDGSNGMQCTRSITGCSVYCTVLTAAASYSRSRHSITERSARAPADSKENPTASRVSFKRRGISLTQLLSKKTSIVSTRKARSESVCVTAPAKYPTHSALKSCASVADAQCLPSPLLASDCGSCVRERAVITFQLPSSSSSSALERIAEAASSFIVGTDADVTTQIDSAIGTGADASTLVIMSTAEHSFAGVSEEVFHANAAAKERSPNASPNGGGALNGNGNGNGTLRVDAADNDADSFANHQKHETRNGRHNSEKNVDSPATHFVEMRQRAHNGSVASSACGLSCKSDSCEFANSNGRRTVIPAIGAADAPVPAPNAARAAPGPSLATHARERARISLQKERKAFRVLGVLMGFFLTCWVPFFLMYLLGPFVPFFDNLANDKFWAVLITWLGYVYITYS